MQGIPPIFLPLSAVLAAVSVVLIAWSWRGRKIDDHPHCRRCTYDLSGRPPDSERCPECGSDLGKRRAIPTGLRRRRRGSLMLGLAILLGITGFWGTYGVQRLRHLTAADKPTWWLLLDARNTNTVVAVGAVDELVWRFQNRRLSTDESRKLGETLLVVQQNAAIVWAYDDAVDQLHTNGVLNETQWQQYWQRAIPLTFRVRSAIRRGDPVPMEISPATTGYLGRPIVAKFRVTRMHVGDVGLPVPDAFSTWRLVLPRARKVIQWPAQRQGLRSPPPSPEPREVLASIPPDVWARLEDGAHEIIADVELLVWCVGGPETETPQTQFPLKARFQIVDTKASASTLTAPNQHRNAVESAISVHRLTLFRTPGGSPAQYIVECKSPPIPVKGVVCVRDADGDHPVGYLDANDSSVTVNVSGGPGTTFDIVVRPAPDLAALTIDITEIWGEEIVKHVTIP